ncbi:MAG: tRNA (adenosine(37)-N6)-threonylcarbamoyltransferase complex dimerization subunit type 1 TsaB [Gemmatimonadaceae bacterium]|nr:tRNA (adenosine(37)-N6)-threonylcarbamoyltransferase complex dimerization subunit type 1 TsaB [Gemmatimonadaceae bacterium]
MSASLSFVDDRPSGVALVLECSTANGSVALLRDDAVIGRSSVAMGAATDDALFPAVATLLAEAGIAAADVTRIICGAGPGSFTSLRIAASVAKGLAHATGAALLAVPSMLLAAATVNVPGRYLVHADALRGERYVLPAIIDEAGLVVGDGDVRRVGGAELVGVLGDRVPLCVTGGPPHDVGRPVVPDAGGLVRVRGWWRVPAEDLAAWEPSYGRLAEAQVKWEDSHQRPLPPSAPSAAAT